MNSTTHQIVSCSCWPGWLLCSLMLIWATGCASESRTSVENAIVKDLVELLSGEFDSGVQKHEDRANGLGPADAHGWVNRAFVEVDAPAIGNAVLVGSTRYGGPSWIVDEDEFLVWTLRADVSERSVVMSPRRFRDYKRQLPHARDAQQLSGLTPENLQSAVSGAACNIVWRRTDAGFSGRSEPCRVMSTTKNQLLDWEWQFELGQSTLNIEFSGTDSAGAILDGTPSPYRLDRVNNGAAAHVGSYLLFNPVKRTDYAEATKLLEQAVASKSLDAATHLALSYAYIKLNNYEAAGDRLGIVREFNRELSGTDALWLSALDARARDDRVAEQGAWEQLLAGDKRNRWAWYELATVYYRGELYPQAIKAIEQALEIAPNEAQWGASYIYYLHSKSHYRTGNLQASIAAAQPGLRNPATQRATYYRKAMAQIAAGEITDPGVVFDQYRTLSTTDGQVNEANLQTNIALLFFELGDYTRAIEHAKTGHELSSGAYQSWALGYSLTEAGDPKAGLNVLNKARINHPDNVNVLAGTGWAYYRLGDLLQAKLFLQAARAASARKNSGVERDLAIVLAALGDPGRAQVPPVRWFGD